MRFALLPFGSRGDVQPMLALGRTLAARGHEVIVGTAPTFADDARLAGLSFAPVGGDFEGFLRGLNDVVAKRELMRALMDYVKEHVPRAFADTLALARSADVDVLVPSSLQQAAPSIAEHLNKPCRSIVFAPVVVPSSTWPPPEVSALGLPRFVNRAIWWGMGRMMHRVIGAPVNAERARLGLAPVDDVVAHLRMRAPIVCTDPPLGALPPDAPSASDGGAIHTGALVVDAARSAPLTAEVEAFLASGTPPIYVGFGSMAASASSGARATDAVLDVVAALDARVILAGGWGGVTRPRHDDPRAHDRALFVDGASHVRLFPRCALVVHHGGAGTTTAAARAGVPQLLVPHAADQFYWGARVRALGLGPAPLPRKRLTADALRARLADVAALARARDASRTMATTLAAIDGNALTANGLERTAPSVSRS